MKKMVIYLFLLVAALPLAAQQKTPVPPGTASQPGNGSQGGNNNPKAGPKPYKEIITDKAVSRSGLFTVHKVDDKWYFEIADSMMNREIIAVTRYSKTPAGSYNYGGERVNGQTIRWEKGPSNNLFLRVVTVVSIATDS